MPLPLFGNHRLTQWTKCNIDGSWTHKEGRGGIGWISRDQDGKVLFGRGYRLGSAIEAGALRWAVSIMTGFGYRNLVVESDSQVLVRMIKGEREDMWPILKPITQDITHSLISFRDYVISYYLREGNKAADRIANETFFIYE